MTAEELKAISLHRQGAWYCIQPRCNGSNHFYVQPSR